MVDRLVNSEANARRIAMVENCFGGSGQPLAVPGRVLVGEGVLTKMCRKKPKPRQFFLFNDILVYGNIMINKKKYNKQHIIPLEEVKLESLADEGQYRNGWLIKTVTKSFAVYAATATEKQEWMAHITKCIEDLLRKSGKKPVEVHAAVWVPDNDATICMHCNKTQFTVLNRRHHCRQCGAVVCGPCSNKKLLLPGQGNGKAVRVCLQCYDAASKVKTRPTTAMDSLNNKDAQRNSADSSGGDSSGDDEEGNKEENHDEVINVLHEHMFLQCRQYIICFEHHPNSIPRWDDESDDTLHQMVSSRIFLQTDGILKLSHVMESTYKNDIKLYNNDPYDEIGIKLKMKCNAEKY